MIIHGSEPGMVVVFESHEPVQTCPYGYIWQVFARIIYGSEPGIAVTFEGHKSEQACPYGYSHNRNKVNSYRSWLPR